MKLLFIVTETKYTVFLFLHSIMRDRYVLNECGYFFVIKHIDLISIVILFFNPKYSYMSSLWILIIFNFWINSAVCHVFPVLHVCVCVCVRLFESNKNGVFVKICNCALKKRSCAFLTKKKKKINKNPPGYKKIDNNKNQYKNYLLGFFTVTLKTSRFNLKS